MTNGEDTAHPTGDRVLTALCNLEGVAGEFVRCYPGSNDSSECNWLEEWFRRRAEAYDKGETEQASSCPSLADMPRITERGACVVEHSVRLEAMRLNYFRGSKAASHPINLAGDLVVLDGPNSAGKTSLAEGMEWLFTGGLSRRTVQGQGNPRELENCISNQFRPPTETTWVEAQFLVDGTETLYLRRRLSCDYGTTQTSQCSSTLSRNGVELTQDEEAELLEKLFGSVAPILMQHTLRQFIHSTPSDRRLYFERLLRLDELTNLIQEAVVGDARLAEFPSPLGSVAFQRWTSLKSLVGQSASKAALRRVERASRDALRGSVENALLNVALREFTDILPDGVTLPEVRDLLYAEQLKVRQASFPLLAQLRPKRAIDDSLQELFQEAQLRKQEAELGKALSALHQAMELAAGIGEHQLAIAQAYKQLAAAGLILQIEERQTCPLCWYESVPTLTSARIETIASWEPFRGLVELAEAKLAEALAATRGTVSSLRVARQDLIPASPSEQEWENALAAVSGEAAEAARTTRELLSKVALELSSFDAACSHLLVDLVLHDIDAAKLADISANAGTLCLGMGSVLAKARDYADCVGNLERAVSVIARGDPQYNLREQWLSTVDELDATVADLGWEEAKRQAQTELATIRDVLIVARQQVLEARRTAFSDGLSSVWKALREDRYSSFSQLHIPEPRGRGFPIEIEVKALLDDNTQQLEVDALKVFSDSQVNVLGLAAFITRSELVGHRLLIFDDPVQSMDEEHFKTFASKLLPSLLAKGFQVIVLTHNDLFAREVSYAHCGLSSYVTMSTRGSRRRGCQVQEGNRRVSERLKLAEKCAEEGDLHGAWRLVRLALERLYTVIYMKHGPRDFDPNSWLNQTAEYMWGDEDRAGVGSIVEKMVPGSGKRLKEILDMTAAGAHDKSPSGATDLYNAVNDIRQLRPQLQIGD